MYITIPCILSPSRFLIVSCMINCIAKYFVVQHHMYTYSESESGDLNYKYLIGIEITMLAVTQM